MRKVSIVFSLLFTISCGSSGNKTPDAAQPVVTPDSGQVTQVDVGNSPDVTQPVVTPDSAPIDTISSVDSGPTCPPAVEPCGGDPTGIWKLVTLCYDYETLVKAFGADDVSRCKMSISEQVTGIVTYTFTSDGRYFQDSSGDGYMTVSMTDECMKSATYSQYNNGTNCTSSNGMSTCRVGGGSESKADAGTSGSVDAGSSEESARYSFLNNTITTTKQDDFEYDWEYATGAVLLMGSKQKYDKLSNFGYCVQGDTLTISEEGAYGTFVRIPTTNSSLPFNPQAPKAESPVPVTTPISVGSAYAEAIPCGGNLLGTWNVSGITIDDDLQQQIITKVRNFDPNGECVYKIDVADSGSATFGELNLWTGKCSVSEQPSLTVSYSSACLAPKNKTCDQLTAPRQSEAASYDAQAVVVCTPLADGNCACTQSRKYTLDSCEYWAELGMGSIYDIGTQQATYSQFSADSYGVNYCVSGNTLQTYSKSFSIYGLEGKATVTAARVGTTVTPATENPGTVAACPAVTKCSGSLTGTWNITAACVASDKASSLAYAFTEYNLNNISECVDSADAKGTGKAEFASNGTFSISLALNISPRFKTKCLNDNKLSCDAALQNQLAFAYPGISCATGATGTCDCTYVKRFPDIGSSTSSANYYGGLQTLKVKSDGTFDLVSTYDYGDVTADFSSKLKDVTGTNIGFIDVTITDAGIYGCAKGDTLTIYTGQLIHGLYLNISGQRAN